MDAEHSTVHLLLVTSRRTLFLFSQLFSSPALTTRNFAQSDPQ